MKQVTESRIIAEDIDALVTSLKQFRNRLQGKTLLFTGSCGFLGKYAILALQKINETLPENKAKILSLDNFVTGYEPDVDTSENVEFIAHNVIEPFEYDGPIDFIVHAAGIASPVYYTKYPIETMDVGTIGTRNMLELAREKKVESFLFTSSSEVYGDPDASHVPTKEDYNGNVSITGPRSCYDESKRFGETMCLAFWRQFEVPVKIVRPFNVYGPGIRPDDFRVLPNFIEHALRHEPLPIHGKGHNTRSFCYINDAIEAIFKLLFSDANGEYFNVGNPEPEVSVKDLAKLVAGSVDHKVAVEHIEPPHEVYANADPKRRRPDISKLQKTIDFRPKYDLKTGLSRTIDWFKKI